MSLNLSRVYKSVVRSPETGPVLSVVGNNNNNKVVTINTSVFDNSRALIYVFVTYVIYVTCKKMSSSFSS